MKKIKKSKGITLVALVITIVILLILAGISIQTLRNQGLFVQAQNAKNLTEEKTAEENDILTNYLEQMNAIIGGQIAETVPDGAVVTPINDITTWLKTGGISKQYSYTTIEQVIADNTCIESLMNNENAMKYLARSTEFADAICESETIMTYLGDSAYVDDTVLNSDLWLSAINNSQYWDKVYPTVIVHSSASATITVNGKTFTANVSGNTNHVMPLGTFSISDSVSGQSFERTITKDTEDVYVMPEGALYWYGNECTWITGGWMNVNHTGTFTKNTNNIYIYTSSGSNETIQTSNSIAYDNRYSKLVFSFSGSGSQQVGTTKKMIYDYRGLSSPQTLTTLSDFLNGKVEFNVWSGGSMSMNAIWLI